MIKEVCVESFSEALAAEKRGADRIELCDNLYLGGTTPSYGTIKMAMEKLTIPAFPIIRPRGGNFHYSKEEIDSAIEIIKKQFASFEGCELHSLSYMPDEECNNADNIEWMNDLRTEDNKEAFTQCIAFKSSFRSPKNGGGAWEANEEYTWSWWLARCEGGEWKLMTWGY